jgi:hypothetical protein
MPSRSATHLRPRENLFADFVVQSFVVLDVRLAVVGALVLMTVCLAVVFVRSARAIRKEHKARFSRIQQQLEADAAALVDRLLRRD